MKKIPDKQASNTYTCSMIDMHVTLIHERFVMINTIYGLAQFHFQVHDTSHLDEWHVVSWVTVSSEVSLAVMDGQHAW